MVKIECVLPYTQAVFGLTGAPIGAGSVPSTWNEEAAESITVTCGAVAYSCEDGSCVVITPAGATKLTGLWPAPAPAPETPAPEAPVPEAPVPEAPVPEAPAA